MVSVRIKTIAHQTYLARGSVKTTLIQFPFKAYSLDTRSARLHDNGINGNFFFKSLEQLHGNFPDTRFNCTNFYNNSFTQAIKPLLKDNEILPACF